MHMLLHTFLLFGTFIRSQFHSQHIRTPNTNYVCVSAFMQNYTRRDLLDDTMGFLAGAVAAEVFIKTGDHLLEKKRYEWKNKRIEFLDNIKKD